MTVKIVEPYQGEEGFTFQLVELEEDQKLEGHPGSTGILIDGITIRIDDIHTEMDESAGMPVLDVDYKIVAGFEQEIPADFDSKVMAAAINIIDEYVGQLPSKTEATHDQGEVHIGAI